MSGGIVFQQLSFLSHHRPYHLLTGQAPPLAVSCPRLHFIARVSSSSADQWLDPKTQRRNKRIAGIEQDELLEPHHLADPDSCFCQFQGVRIHHKLCTPPPLPQPSNINSAFPPVILLHGFGASVFSWSRVMKRLAEVATSKVLAFDRPAFGLTSRPDSFTLDDTKPFNPYSMAFAVLATLYFIDFLASDKAILIGHSAGSLVAVNAYFEAPERIAALILVAPAIIAPRAAHKVSGINEAASDTHSKKYGSNSNIFTELSIKLLEILSKFTANIAQAMMQMVKGTKEMLNSMYKKMLSAIFCSAFGVMLIRTIIDKFGIAAVRTAWYDSNQVTEHVLDGYTKPLRAKGWDKALAKFTAAAVASSESDLKLPVSKRLHEISCPVLIVTGDSDRIVPAWNAKRLSQAIPGSSLEIIKHCGHLPHEEKVEEFVLVVEKFLQRAFSDSMEASLQTII
ncbi:uncharacterized protein LOC126660513 [Mercurialis annua]|uniref:uncharacterized protein LOC126660513 n=1 Tax=Mercurialis annua TaxID=3986 RepID=UPI00215F0617|nr:uncharacterized protein LOC126660513 [Mercurialis annua]